MAVTVSLAQIAYHSRQTAAQQGPVPDEVKTLLRPLVDWAAAEVIASTTEAAPDAAHNTAVIALVSYLVDVPPASRHTAYGNAWANSGAAMILRRWLKRRAVAVSNGAAPRSAPPPDPAPIPDPGGDDMPTPELPQPAGVRFFVPVFDASTLGGVQLPAMQAQDLFDAALSEELTADVERRLSVGAPVPCWSQAFTYGPANTPQGFRWAVLAIAQGDDHPSHYRIDGTVALVDFAERWRASPGAAVAGGVTYDVCIGTLRCCSRALHGRPDHNL